MSSSIENSCSEIGTNVPLPSMWGNADTGFRLKRHERADAFRKETLTISQICKEFDSFFICAALLSAQFLRCYLHSRCATKMTAWAAMLSVLITGPYLPAVITRNSQQVIPG